jgi:pyruvate dehydrogenase E2 component (dihydrolipoamide acetyltransferase)
MATLVTMPEVMANATEAVLNLWLKNPGDAVAAGDPVAEIETEKASVELAAESDGVLARILATPGESVPVGAPIYVLAASGESTHAIDAVMPEAQPAENQSPEPVPLREDTVRLPTAVAPGRRPDGRLLGSPLARRAARQNGIDLSTLAGTGPDGRILRKDVEHAIRGQAATQGERAQPAAQPQQAEPNPQPQVPAAAEPAQMAGAVRIGHTKMRKAIARRLSESKQTVPHFYLTVDVAVAPLIELRRTINESAPRRITVNDLVVKAAAGALIDVPAANSTWGEDAVTQYDHADVAVAIAIEGGLVTPVVRSADTMSVGTLSTTVADYAERAKAGRLRQDELIGGTLSVTNLGMFGIREFSAIINPPQAAILAVGAAEERAVARDGKLSIETVMTCTLSADHRVLDGATAAEWLNAFRSRIEKPFSLLV